MADQLEDHVAVEAHPLGAFADVGAVLLHQPSRFRVQHLDADFLQHLERGEMDRLQFVRRNQVRGWERDAQLPEGRLLERARTAGALARAPSAAGSLGRRRGIRPRCWISHLLTRSMAIPRAYWPATRLANTCAATRRAREATWACRAPLDGTIPRHARLSRRSSQW